MLGNAFVVNFHVPGTLAANIGFRWVAPFDCSLIHAQAVASNASNATIIIGTSADDNGYLTSSDVGDSGTPAEFDRDNFTGALVSPSGEYPHITNGTIVVVTVDYDGSSGTAAQNLSVALTFLEG